jgi:hypothetical protein
LLSRDSNHGFEFFKKTSIELVFFIKEYTEKNAKNLKKRLEEIEDVEIVLSTILQSLSWLIRPRSFKIPSAFILMSATLTQKVIKNQQKKISALVKINK